MRLCATWLRHVFKLILVALAVCRFESQLALQVISGLHELHSSGLWHGQLSPETVLLRSHSQPWLAGACLLPSEPDQEQSLTELTARWHQWQVLYMYHSSLAVLLMQCGSRKAFVTLT